MSDVNGGIKGKIQQQKAADVKRMDGIRTVMDGSYRCAARYCADFATVRNAVTGIVNGEQRFVRVSVDERCAPYRFLPKRDSQATFCFAFEKGGFAHAEADDFCEHGRAEGTGCLVLVSRNRSNVWTYVGIEVDEDKYTEKEALDIRNRIKPLLDRKLHNECDKNWAWECDKRRRIDRMKNASEWVDSIPLFVACLAVLVFAVVVCVAL